MDTTQFISKAYIVHNNRYNYSLVNYTNDRTNVQIQCGEHGIFSQNPNNHLQGNGCKKCASAILSETKIGRYTNKFFEEYPEAKQINASLYLAEFKNSNEHLLKVGITIKDANSRFGRTGNFKNYKVRIIKQMPLKLFEAFSKEQTILFNFKEFKQQPRVKFNGYTECFLYDINLLQELNECLTK